LELGGKDPTYVRADADPLNAAGNLVDGAMYNSDPSVNLGPVAAADSIRAHVKDAVDKGAKLL
ncbi:UNVERIFIED_CONTAM: hypothetical protein HDU68_005672, partial [Siphonaria sp. JEL0065]